MTKRPLIPALALLLCLALLLAGAAADVNPNSYKVTITKVSVGAPITGLDGKKYIPVDVHFTSEADPDESGQCFLEGVIKAVHDGVENDVSGVGMTLMRVSGTPGNNQFDWDPNTKKGVAKFNIPVLDNGEAQTVEHSQATGLDEVNGLKEGNTAKISFESVVYGAEGCPVLQSNEAVIVYKPSELPKDYAVESGGGGDEPACDHKDTGRYTKSKDDDYHGVYCAKCNQLVLTTSHVKDTRRDTEASNWNENGSIDGMQLVEYCEDCEWSRKFACTHEGTIRYVNINSTYHNHYCTRCNGVGMPAQHSYGAFEGGNYINHVKTCVCGATQEEKHTLGKRKFYKYQYDKVWNTYYVFFTQDCSVCQTQLNGYVAFTPGLTDYWMDYTEVLKEIVKSGTLPDEWATYKPSVTNQIKAALMATGFNKVASWLDNVDYSKKYGFIMLDSNRLMNGAAMEVRAFRKDGQEIPGKRFPNPKGLVARGVGDVETNLDQPLDEAEVAIFDLTDLDDAFFVFNGPMLAGLEEGEHTITLLVEGADEDGNLLFDENGGAEGMAVEMVFTVFTVKDANGNDVKCVSDIVPAGSCMHLNAVTAFNHEGHWLYCPDCEKGIPGTFEEHFTDWRTTRYEDIETVRVTVPGMEQTDEIPANIAMGVGNTVQFLSDDMTFTYLPDDSGVISAKNDASDSWYIPGGFAASHNDPWPEVTDKYSVMIPGAEMMMSMEYEDCGYGILDIFIGHGDRSKIWGDKWFAAAGETVTFGVNPQAGFRCNVVVRSGNTVIPYAAGSHDGEFTFSMPAGNVMMEITTEPLPRLTLPGKVLTVEESAFEGCGAYFIVVPDGCTSIEANAFKDCPNLEAVLIPATVTEIDPTAFDGCVEVCIYGEEGSLARDYSYQHHNTYFFTIEKLGE